MSVNDMTAPKITKNLKGTIAERGSTVVFEAEVEGSPAPKCVWIKDAQQVWPNPGKTEITYSNGKAKLSIHKAVYTDSGNYKLEISNPKGSAWTSAELKVKQ